MEKTTAIVYDALQVRGGMERVLAAVLELFPQADVFTLLAEPGLFHGTRLAQAKLHTSFIQRLPGARRHYRRYLPLMPLAVEQFDLRAYERVISLSYAVAHGALAAPGAQHLCYLATPLRYAWQAQHAYYENSRLPRFLTQPIATLVFHYMRLWTLAAAQRVDRFATCSEWIANCTWRAYRRPAQVIYPPVAVEGFQPATQRQGYYVTLARLTSHKRLDVVVKAFKQTGLPLWVIGEGPEKRRLQALAGPQTRFSGWLSDDEVRATLGQARGLVCAAEEDFGIGLVEAQAAGCPVLAFRGGGALETVVEGETGMFFDQQDANCLAEALLQFEAGYSRFQPSLLQQHAQRFNQQRFMQEFKAFIDG